MEPVFQVPAQFDNADKEDTRKLVHSINRVLQEVPISESDLDELFDAMWPNLERSLAAIPGPDESVEVKRSTEDIVAEILAWTRAESQRRPAPGPSLHLKLEVNGRPLFLEIAGLPVILEPMIRPALGEFLRARTEKAIDGSLSTGTGEAHELEIAPQA